MPRTVDHIVETHQLAAARVAAGLPVWAERINLRDVFHNDNMTFVERRDAIVAAIRVTRWYRNVDEDDWLREIVENLACADDADEFDGWWDELYDQADIDRVWIGTI